MNYPHTPYQIFNSADLDDLVIWWVAQPESTTNYADNCTIRRRVNDCIPDNVCFSGQLDSQNEYDPLGDDVIVLPVIYHIKLNPNTLLKVFLWITRTTIELHIPEIFFVSGIPLEDKQNLKMVQNLAENLSDAFRIQWSLAEYDGREIPIDNITAFWEEYISDLFTRISYEELDP